MIIETSVMKEFKQAFGYLFNCFENKTSKITAFCLFVKMLNFNFGKEMN